MPQTAVSAVLASVFIEISVVCRSRLVCARLCARGRVAHGRVLVNTHVGNPNYMPVLPLKASADHLRNRPIEAHIASSNDAGGAVAFGIELLSDGRADRDDPVARERIEQADLHQLKI